jgi:hypothetical protein
MSTVSELALAARWRPPPENRRAARDAQIAAAHKTTRRLYRIVRSSPAQSKALHVALYCHDALILSALDRLFALHPQWRSA